MRLPFIPWSICGSALAPGASGLPYHGAFTCARSVCTWHASCVDPEPKKKKGLPRIQPSPKKIPNTLSEGLPSPIGGCLIINFSLSLSVTQRNEKFETNIEGGEPKTHHTVTGTYAHQHVRVYAQMLSDTVWAMLPCCGLAAPHTIAPTYLSCLIAQVVRCVIAVGLVRTACLALQRERWWKQNTTMCRHIRTERRWWSEITLSFASK